MNAENGTGAAHGGLERKWWTLFAMCFALFMIMLDNTIVNVALPSIQRSLHTTPARLQWTIDAYVLSFAVLILVGGKLGDRFGRKRIFLAGLTIFTLASAACALATSDTGLIASRAVQGVGGALLNPLSLAILVAAFPRRQLATAVGIWAGISSLGLAVGPLAGGFLVERFSWSAVFWVNVPIGLIAAAVTLWAVTESRDHRSRHLDLVGTGLVTGGLLAIVWALIETDTHAWGSAYTLGFLGAGALLLALFIAWEQRAPDPMLPLGFFRRPAFSTASAVVLLVGFSFFGVVYFITLYFQNVNGYSPLEAGVRSLPMTVMVMLLGPLAGRLNARFGARVQLSVGMLLLSAGLFGLSHIQVASSYNAIWPFYVVIGVGMGLAMPAVSATGMAAVDRDRSGIASGVINANRQVGGALGIAVLGSVGATLARTDWQQQLANVTAHARLVPSTLRIRPTLTFGCAHKRLSHPVTICQPNPDRPVALPRGRRWRQRWTASSQALRDRDHARPRRRAARPVVRGAQPTLKVRLPAADAEPDQDPDRYPPPVSPDPARSRDCWGYSAVLEILRNPKYTGYMVWNRRASKKGGRHNPPEAWIWSPQPTHQPIVSRELFAAAQHVAGQRRGSRSGAGLNRHPQTRRSYPLRSLVTCELCGRKMRGKLRRKARREYVYYACEPPRSVGRQVAAQRQPEHPASVLVRGDLLLRGVLEFFALRLFGPERRALLAQDLPNVARGVGGAGPSAPANPRRPPEPPGAPCSNARGARRPRRDPV